jgi:predicted metal-binding protein
LRKRRGAFAAYPADEELTLVGIINCPGCPTLTGTDKLLSRIRGLTEFKVDAIHLSYCMKALCPFTKKYAKALSEAFPDVRVVVGTHKETDTPQEYRQRIKRLFNQDRMSMVDVILQRDDG